MVFLDTKKNVWVIKNLEVPVIEDVPMKEMKWFRDKIKWAAEREEKQDITTTQALETDEEWWEKTTEIGLGLTVDEVLDTGITEPDFRELMAEIYNFLANLGTIERAKQSVLYDPKIQKKGK